MKKILLVAALAPFFAFQCDKSITTKCVKGKVIRISCASYVIQVLNNDSVGEDQWKDSRDPVPNTFDNVFAVSNPCNIPSNYKVGDTIYFNLDEPKPSECVTCMMYDAPPTVKYQVSNVSSSSCE